jgi:hypothetical protein
MCNWDSDVHNCAAPLAGTSPKFHSTEKETVKYQYGRMDDVK